MKFKSLSLFTVLLFAVGVLLQLSLSSGVIWAEVEAGIYGTQTTGDSLNLNCPLMLSSSEAGIVTASVANTLNQPVSPVITTEISQTGGMQSLSQTLLLAPYETRIVQWSVNDSDLIFGRLILMNVIQGRYGDLVLRHGYCGILFFDLFNLTGSQSLILIIISSLAFILAGGIFWIRIQAPLDELADQTLKACGGLVGVTTLAMLTSLPRWWGLTLFLDAFALIMLSVIFTEFLLFPKHN